MHASVDACSCVRREVTREFLAACPPVVDRIMSAFALGLGLPEDYFKEVGLCISCSNLLDLHVSFPVVLTCKAETSQCMPSLLQLQLSEM